MSELAGPYYRERAERLGIDRVPTVLNGEAVTLLDPDQNGRLSLQRPDAYRLEIVSEGIQEVALSVTEFVMESYRKTHGTMPTRPSKKYDWINEKHALNVVEKRLFPKHLKAGHITDIQIESVARDEVLDSYHKRLAYTVGNYGEDNEVYLVASGALYAGRDLGYTACMLMISPGMGTDNDARPIVTPRFSSLAFSKNDLLAKSGLEQSRANRTYIDMWGVANARTQNVRRGKDQPGTR